MLVVNFRCCNQFIFAIALDPQGLDVDSKLSSLQQTYISPGVTESIDDGERAHPVCYLLMIKSAIQLAAVHF